MRIFLSTPISSYRDEKKLQTYKAEVIELVERLKCNNTVYSEIEKITSEMDYDLPEDSITSDFNAICECEAFIMHYPTQTPTSALIELGFALANKKRVIIITPSIQSLPYLAQGIRAIDGNSVIIQSKNLSDSIFEVIKALEDNRV